MPVFRFNDKAFGIARSVKALLNLESGTTRDALPEAEQHKDLAENLVDNARQTLSQRKRRLKSQSPLTLQQESGLRAAEERGEANSDEQTVVGQAGELETGTLPDFVIIGAQKSGTTSLYHLLTQHPHVEPAAKKELHYFDIRFDRGIDWYRRSFPSPRWKDGRRIVTGEATPYYLFHPHVAKRLADAVPNARLIAMLRNPIDRAYSHYQQAVRKGFETLTFEEAIEAEEARLRDERDKMLEDEHYVSFDYQRLSYLSRGIYVDQLLHWTKFFGDEQILVLKSEDFFERMPDTMKLILDFLDLQQWEYGASEILKKGYYEQRMVAATRQRLKDYFEPHNQRLYEYLGVDFEW